MLLVIWPLLGILFALLFSVAEAPWSDPLLGFAGPFRAAIAAALLGVARQIFQGVRRKRWADWRRAPLVPLIEILMMAVVTGIPGLVWVGVGVALHAVGIS